MEEGEVMEGGTTEHRINLPPLQTGLGDFPRDPFSVGGTSPASSVCVLTLSRSMPVSLVSDCFHTLGDMCGKVSQRCFTLIYMTAQQTKPANTCLVKVVMPDQPVTDLTSEGLADLISSASRAKTQITTLRLRHNPFISDLSVLVIRPTNGLPFT